jgi:hypothetical protein
LHLRPCVVDISARHDGFGAIGSLGASTHDASQCGKDLERKGSNCSLENGGMAIEARTRFDSPIFIGVGNLCWHEHGAQDPTWECMLVHTYMLHAI